jgi:hypothetical protein
MARYAKRLRNLVDLVGFEPTTSSMPWKRAPNCATGPYEDRKPRDQLPANVIFAYRAPIVKPVGRESDWSRPAF